VEIRGVAIPADANLLLLVGSANRDEAVFGAESGPRRA
jgi:cytochrome P450